MGTCPVGSCRYDTRRHSICPPDGFICPKTETEEIDCGDIFGNVTVEIVKECGCCKDEGITVQGTVIAADNGEALVNIRINVNGEGVAETDDLGMFSFTVKTGVSTVTLVALDPTGEFLEGVTVVEIPENFRGPVETTIPLVRQALPITITDPTVDSTFSLSGTPEDPDQGVAQVIIQANTLVDANGNSVAGPVQISINYIDTTDPDVETVLPGRFITDDGEPLITDGVFNLEVTDEDGNQLGGTVLLRVREGMTLWNLDEETGSWVLADILNRRKRRQVTLTEELLVEINNNKWVNIDKIPGSPRCYFKARVVYENAAEVGNPVSFRPQILAFTPNSERLRLYASATSSPDTECFEVRCLPFDAADPTNILFGFINLTAYESATIGGASVPVVTALTPLNLVDYSAAIQTAHTAVEYSVAPNLLDIFANFISSASGPFYTDRAVCEASDITLPAFHFTKPELPIYETAPTGTDICTARILFDNGYMFSNVVANLTTLPEVTALSAWSINGSNFFHSYTTNMQFSTVDDEFYFACIEYRCSTTDAETDVYISIEAPLIEVNMTNYGEYKNETNSTTVMVPAFECYGNCESEICYQSSSGINGTFTVNSNGADGPDFWDSTSTNCTMTSAFDAFAYQLYCYGNRQSNYNDYNDYEGGPALS